MSTDHPFDPQLTPKLLEFLRLGAAVFVDDLVNGKRTWKVLFQGDQYGNRNQNWALRFSLEHLPTEYTEEGWQVPGSLRTLTPPTYRERLERNQHWKDRRREQGDTVPREPGCQCHQEIGDSPCRVHGDEGDPDAAPSPVTGTAAVPTDISTARGMAHAHLGACQGEHTKACDMLTIEFGSLLRHIEVLAVAQATHLGSLCECGAEPLNAQGGPAPEPAKSPARDEAGPPLAPHEQCSEPTCIQRADLEGEHREKCTDGKGRYWWREKPCAWCSNPTDERAESTWKRVAGLPFCDIACCGKFLDGFARIPAATTAEPVKPLDLAMPLLDYSEEAVKPPATLETLKLKPRTTVAKFGADIKARIGRAASAFDRDHESTFATGMRYAIGVVNAALSDYDVRDPEDYPGARTPAAGEGR